MYDQVKAERVAKQLAGGFNTILDANSESSGIPKSTLALTVGHILLGIAYSGPGGNGQSHSLPLLSNTPSPATFRQSKEGLGTRVRGAVRRPSGFWTEALREILSEGPLSRSTLINALKTRFPNDADNAANVISNGLTHRHLISKNGRLHFREKVHKSFLIKTSRKVSHPPGFWKLALARLINSYGSNITYAHMMELIKDNYPETGRPKEVVDNALQQGYILTTAEGFLALSEKAA